MRVLFHALQAGNRSGTGRYIVELIKAMAALENGPELVCLWPKKVPVPARCPQVEWVQCFSNFAGRFFREQWDTGRLVQKYGVDMVHFPASVATFKTDAPQVVTVHDLCFKSHPEWFPRARVLYYNTFIGPGIRSAARVLADSRATAEDIKRFYPIPASRIDIVPLGVDACFRPVAERECEQVRNVYGLPESFFLFVGTLEPRKNLPRVLEAWTMFEESFPDLVIAGRAGWKLNLKSYIKDNGYADRRIHCLDHVPADYLPALYSGAKALVWPSLMEGFGLPPLEAMACGTPVITSNTSSMPEVVGNAALMVEPTDVKALAMAMKRLVSDNPLCGKLRLAGFKRVETFSWQRSAEMTVETYKKVCRDIG